MPKVPSNQKKLKIVKVDLNHVPEIRMPNFEPVPTLYMELLENKDKILESLRNVNFKSDLYNGTINSDFFDLREKALKDTDELLKYEDDTISSQPVIENTQESYDFFSKKENPVETTQSFYENKPQEKEQYTSYKFEKEEPKSLVHVSDEDDIMSKIMSEVTIDKTIPLHSSSQIQPVQQPIQQPVVQQPVQQPVQQSVQQSAPQSQPQV